MSDNHNEAEALFATRRKKQQDEEAQRAAQKAEEERLAELERQRQQVEEDLKKLETLQALQKQQAEMEAQKAQAEREALAAQKAAAEAEAERMRAQAAAEAERVRKEREALAAQKAKAEMEAKKAREEQQAIALKKAQEERDAARAQKAAQKAQAEADREARKALKAEQKAAEGIGAEGGINESAAKGSFDIRKFLPFIIGGVAVAAVVVVLLVTGVFSSKDKDKDKDKEPGSNNELTADSDLSYSLGGEMAEADWYRTLDDYSGITYVYPSTLQQYSDEQGNTYYYYYDEENGQTASVYVFPSLLTEEEKYNYLDEDRITTYLENTMSGLGVYGYSIVKVGDNLWYAADSLDNKQSGDSMTAALFGIVDNQYILEFECYISREEVATERYIDIDDMVYLFEKMADNLSVG